MRSFAVTVLLLAASHCLAGDDPALQGMKLIWQDDFEEGTMERYEPTDRSAWSIDRQDGNTLIALTKKNSDFKPPFRSPLNRMLIRDLKVADFVMDIRLQSTIADYDHRSLCLFFGYQNDARLYYVHFGKKTDDHANQIFIVNNAARTKISTSTTAGTPWDDEWHRARIVRKAATGEISVFFDNLETPVMTAADSTFTDGLVGFGSFDDTGNFDDIRIYVPESEAARP